MKKRVGERLIALSAVALGMSAGIAQGAAIEYVKVSTSLIPGIGTLTYSSLTGLSSQGSPTPGNSVTFDSTPNVLEQTAAFVSGDANQINGSQNYHTIGYADADLSTGEIRLLASSVHTNGVNPVNGRADAAATMRDLVTFNNTTGSSVAIDVFFSMDGLMNIGEPGRGFVSLRFCLGASCNLAGNTILSNVLDYYFTFHTALNADGHYLTMPTTGWVSTSFQPGNDPENAVFHGKYLVPNGTSTADLFAQMQLSCGINTVCDYTNTGTLSFGLPTGVTFGSQSGALLSNTVDAVPEPATYAMMTLGLSAVAIIRRRRSLRR